MRAAIQSTILIATLAGPLAAQAKIVLGVAPTPSTPRDVTAKLFAFKAVRLMAAVQACARATATASPAPHPARPAPARIAPPASTIAAVSKDAILSAQVHRLRPAVLRL